MKKGDKSRKKILDVAIRLLAERGFFETSFEAIAGQADLTQTAVLYHFKNKFELLKGVLGRIVENDHQHVVSRFSEDDSPLEKLLKYFMGNLEWALGYPAEIKIALLLYYTSTYNDDCRNVYTVLLGNARQKLINFIQAGRESHLFDISEENVRHTAEILHEMLIGGIINTIAAYPQQENFKQDLEIKWEKAIKFAVGYNEKHQPMQEMLFTSPQSLME